MNDRFIHVTFVLPDRVEVEPGGSTPEGAPHGAWHRTSYGGEVYVHGIEYIDWLRGAHAEGSELVLAARAAQALLR